MPQESSPLLTGNAVAAEISGPQSPWPVNPVQVKSPAFGPIGNDAPRSASSCASSIHSSSSGRSHREHHFESPEIVRDAIIGLSDGLTVPFALAAGLSSLDNTWLVVTAGFAELVAGAISMGLGGYLAAISERDHYDAERRREQHEVRTMEAEEIEETYQIMKPYGLRRIEIEPIITRFRANPSKWVDFMMKFELGLERPDPRRSWISALTIGFAYFFGGLVPLIPYVFMPRASDALLVSVVVTLIALFIFGYAKSRLISPDRVWIGAFQTMFVGAMAAGGSYTLVKLFPENRRE